MDVKEALADPIGRAVLSALLMPMATAPDAGIRSGIANLKRNLDSRGMELFTPSFARCIYEELPQVGAAHNGTSALVAFFRKWSTQSYESLVHCMTSLVLACAAPSEILDHHELLRQPVMGRVAVEILRIHGVDIRTSTVIEPGRALTELYKSAPTKSQDMELIFEMNRILNFCGLSMITGNGDFEHNKVYSWELPKECEEEYWFTRDVILRLRAECADYQELSLLYDTKPTELCNLAVSLLNPVIAAREAGKDVCSNGGHRFFVPGSLGEAAGSVRYFVPCSEPATFVSVGVKQSRIDPACKYYTPYPISARHMNGYLQDDYAAYSRHGKFTDEFMQSLFGLVALHKFLVDGVKPPKTMLGFPDLAVSLSDINALLR